MSDHNELNAIQEFVGALLSGLSKEVARTSDRPTHGGLFPGGVNDILLNLKFGSVSLGFEVSSAKDIHGIEPKTAFIKSDGEELETPQIPIHPMLVLNTTNRDVFVGVSGSPNGGTEVRPGAERTVDGVYISNVQGNTATAWIQVSNASIPGSFKVKAHSSITIPWQ